MRMTSPCRAAAAAAEGVWKARPGPTSRILGCADSAVGNISISRAIAARRIDGHDPSGCRLGGAGDVPPPHAGEVQRDALAMRRLRQIVREMREALPSIIRWNLA